MENLALLALLLCPIGMGLMMLFMGKEMKGMHGGRQDAARHEQPEDQRRDPAESRERVGAAG